MGEAAISPSLTRQIRAAAEAARHAPRPEKIPPLVAVAAPTPACDPLAWFAAGRATQAFYWEQPQAGFAFAAEGIALDASPPDGDRFGGASAHWQALSRTAVCRGTDGVDASLLATGAFSFDEHHPDDAVWGTLPRDIWRLPARIAYRRDGTSWFQVQARADDPAAMAQAEAALHAAVRGQSPGDCQAEPAADTSRGESRLERVVVTPREPEWDAAVEALLQAIGSGDVEKVVLARRLRVRASQALNVPAMLRRLRERYPNATIFAVRHSTYTFLGASPERLVSLEGRRVQASAIAGTAANGGSGEALLADEKERWEHDIVVKALRNGLGPVCDELEIPSFPVVMQLPGIQHLYTPVRGHTRVPRTVLDLVQRLHPTPAVGGTPRARALELQRAHEPFNRGWYAGPLGWMDGSGSGDFIVALRSALVHDDHADLFAGCGLVVGSDSEREWAEAELKLGPMLWATQAQ